MKITLILFFILPFLSLAQSSEVSFQFKKAEQYLRVIFSVENKLMQENTDTLELEKRYQNIEQAIASSGRLHRFLNLNSTMNLPLEVLVSDSNALVVTNSSSWTVEYLLELVRPSTLSIVEISSTHAEPLPEFMIDSALVKDVTKANKKSLKKKKN
ncbi:hypothetical protein [Ekhidna sp.]|uniref:hypothetical protein n=1 Tax=Ekhidna sp. TaxID=2608089 RepID=UPI003298DA80